MYRYKLLSYRTVTPYPYLTYLWYVPSDRRYRTTCNKDPHTKRNRHNHTHLNTEPTMSAAAARRRKQLLARKKADNQDVLTAQLQKVLFEPGEDEPLDEATAYEALQLAQSQVNKKLKSEQYSEAAVLASRSSLVLLKKDRVSVASQMMSLLVEVLRETHTEETDEWLDRLVELHVAFAAAMGDKKAGQETNRLQRLQRDWLGGCVQWSSELGKYKFGSNRLQEIMGQQCWKLALLEQEFDEEGHDEEEVMDLQCSAVQHMALAEKPDQIIDWLKTLPTPTKQQTTAGHDCAPGIRDALLTRSLLLMCALENLRDGNVLLRSYLKDVEERDADKLAASYTDKSDGKAPSHAIFGCMLLRVCEKDARTGPLYSWLMRSFKKELEKLYKPQTVAGYTSKIGKIYFNIQPPPNMLK